MTQETIISKVQKLLRLSTSSNANEAALAASKAQELIDRHNLSATLLALEQAEPIDTLDEPIEDFYQKGAPLDSQKTAQTWRARLALVVSELNGCRCYLAGGDIALVGRPTDAETVRYVYGYLTREVERLTTEIGKGMGTTWRNNFRLGVVETVSRKLREGRQAFNKTVRDEATSTMALMRVDNAMARIERRGETTGAWVKQNLKLRKRTISSHAAHDHSARTQGRRAGESINVNGGGKGMGTGQKRIG